MFPSEDRVARNGDRRPSSVIARPLNAKIPSGPCALDQIAILGAPGRLKPNVEDGLPYGSNRRKVTFSAVLLRIVINDPPLHTGTISPRLTTEISLSLLMLVAAVRMIVPSTNSGIAFII